jgi:hypothetical protein
MSVAKLVTRILGFVWYLVPGLVIAVGVAAVLGGLFKRGKQDPPA